MENDIIGIALARCPFCKCRMGVTEYNCEDDSGLIFLAIEGVPYHDDKCPLYWVNYRLDCDLLEAIQIWNLWWE